VSEAVHTKKAKNRFAVSRLEKEEGI
jgi:hypothetical protein